MASGGEKNWNRPWSMEEMMENAENWSLAGDVALLNTLKAYSENLFSRTVSISDNVDNLLHSLDEVGLKLNLSQSEFQSLRNTQFIESRVYEDDETLDYKEEVKPEKKVMSDEEKEKLMKESVLEGLRVMDKYFEKIEVSISDSEEEESDKSYILRPKDMYEDRALPLVIGTEEWYKKWHVGLADSDSESESEKVSETYSDSDSGDDLPKDLMKGSETSSELDFSSQTSDNRPVANSTFNDSVKKPNVFGSDDESDGQGSVPVKTPISSKSFAEQLAAKLGDVISERKDVSPEINKKPIQPVQKNKFAGDLFSDEPPPLDDLEDTILPKSAQEGLFSGGQGLFDDNEDDLFWGQQNKGPSVKPSEETDGFKKEIQAASENVVTSSVPKPLQVSKGPFDTDTDSSDEDIFSAKPKTSKQPFLQPFATTAPLFAEEPPELETAKKPTEDALKKKPIGGVSIFGKSDIFSGEKVENTLKSRQQPSQPIVNLEKNNETVKPKQPNLFDEDEGKVIDTIPAAVNPKPQKISLFDDEDGIKSESAANSKKISLFDDDDDLFKDDLFSGITSKKLTSNLFDDVGNSEDLFPEIVNKKDTPKVDLFSDLGELKVDSTSKTADKPKKTLDLFSAEEEEEGGDLFGVPDVNKVVDVEKKTVISNKTVAVHDEVDKAVKIVEDLPQRQVIGAEKLSVEQKLVKGLFDESPKDSDTEDLFKEVKVKKTQFKTDLFEETAENVTENLQNKPEPKETSQSQPTDSKPEDTLNAVEKSQPKSAINLFGSSPPPDDDDWDTKSVQSSDNEDQFSYRIDYNTAGSSLFDNEPPSLGPNESSGIVRDQNTTRVDTDDSSFNPYASSSRRLSSDVFNEQQSQDSFFVTKNRTESINVPPQLDKIPEVGQGSNLDITPSGNLEDLEDSKGDSSVFEDDPQKSQTAISDTKKPISLFDDEFDQSPDTDDLFSSITKNADMPKLSNKRLSLFDNIEDVLDTKTKKTKPISEEKKDPVLETTKSNELSKESAEKSVSGTVGEEKEKEVKKPPTGSPGKLKHNLKINVNALIPGAAPPKLKEMTKSHSLDLPKDQTTTPIHASSPDIGYFTPTVSKSHKNLSNIGSEKAVSFEDALDNIEVLHSVTKDRAKIPIKRRPSTRRGRKKAIENTSGEYVAVGGEDNVETGVEEAKIGEIKPQVVRAELEATPKPVVPEVPSSPDDFETPPFQTPMSEVKQTKKEIVFDTENEVEDLFSNSSTKNAAKDKAKGSIFESEDSDGDLFAHMGAKKAKKEDKHKKAEKVKKKSLFNDSSSDEDLFSANGGGRSKKRENAPKVVEKRPHKSSATRKLENIETDEDPLSSLLK